MAEIVRQRVAAAIQSPVLRLADHPRLLALANQVLIEPADAEQAGCFFRHIELLTAQAATYSNPLMINCPQRGSLALTRNDIHLQTLPTGDELGLDRGRPTSNIIIPGPTGSGKSTFTRMLVSQLFRFGYIVIYLDRKHEARMLLKHPLLTGDVSVLRGEDLAISLYQPPPGQNRSEVLAWVTDLLAQCTGRIFAQRTLEEVIDELNHHVTSDEGFPLELLIDRLRRMPVRGGWRQQDLKEGMLLALTHVRTHLGDVFNYTQSDLLPTLFDHPHVFIVELPSLPADLYTLLVSYLIRWPYEWRLRCPQAHRIPIVFIIDDATVAVDAKMDANSPGGVSPLVEQSFMGRGLNIGLIIDLHALGQASPKLLKNAETLICTGARGEDPRLLQTLFGINPEQADYLRTLQPGHVVSLVPSKHPKALPGTFARGFDATVSDNECRLSARGFLDRVRARRYVPAHTAPPPPAGSAAPATTPPTPASSSSTAAPPATPSPSSASAPSPPPARADADDGIVLRMLMCLTEPLPAPITTLYQRLGLSRVQGSRLLRRLQNLGFVVLHRLSTGRRGGTLSIAEPTDHARRWLKDHSATLDPPRHTRGGFLHNAAAEALLRLGKAQRSVVAFEVDLGPVRVDVQWRSTGGQVFLFQIGVSDPQREADALIRAWTVPAVHTSRLILICSDKTFATEVIKSIKTAGGGPELLAHLERRLLGSLLERAASASTPVSEPNNTEWSRS